MSFATYRTGAIVVIAVVIAIAIGWYATSGSAADSWGSCNVAYIPLHGTMVTYIPDSESASSSNEQDQTASSDVTQSIRDADADPSIQAIIVEIDSPGGDPVAGEEIESALKQSSKPTVALIRSEGDSAAYMAASGASRIFASQFSDVGDIGITSSYTDQSKQDQESGITFNQLSIGKYKDMFDPDKPLTADERTLIMSQLQTAYQYFVHIVSANRRLATSTVTTLADGESFLGAEALSDGLIDQIGNVDDVRTYLTQKLATDAVICGIDTD
jgi:protease-4